MTYRLWVNDTRTVLVRLWDNGTVEVATRQHQAETWGPPVFLTEEVIYTPEEPAVQTGRPV